MAINVIVQYNGGFLSDILLLIQAPIFLYGSMTLLSYIITTILTMYYSVFCFVMFGGSACRFNISVQYNGGLLPDVILLTPFKYHVVCVCVCVCVCVLSSYSFWTSSSLDVPTGVTQEGGHTGGGSHRISHPPSFCSACLNFSREKDSAIPFPRRP